MSDKYMTTNFSTSTNKAMAANNSAVSNDHIALNLDKRSDFDFVANFTPIYVHRSSHDAVHSPAYPA
jgi:hypothetical protein